MKRTALIMLLVGGLALAQAGDKQTRPLVTIPLDGDDMDTYGVWVLEQKVTAPTERP